jgi:hypothetical protein
MDPQLGLTIWLGMAGITLVAAQIFLWRTRRVLSRQDPPVLDIRLAPCAVVKEARLAPSPFAESASSVRAS